MSASEKNSLPIFQDPVLRSFCEQEKAYEKLMIEARSRSTEPGRLVEICKMGLRELVDRSPFLGDFDYYQGFRERQIFTQFATDSEVRSEVLVDGRFINEEISKALEANPTLMAVDDYFASTHNIPEFSFLGSVALANPNYPASAIDSLIRDSDYVCFWNDYLYWEHHPSLFYLLEMTDMGTSYEIDVHWWLALSGAIRAIDTSEELDQLVEQFDSKDLIGFDGSIDDFFDDFVSQILPFLVGSSQEFLERSFEIDSHPIQQAILLNPSCTIDIRTKAIELNSDRSEDELLFIPDPVQLALYAAHLGKYNLIDNWISAPEQMDSFIGFCDPYINDAISELNLDSSLYGDQSEANAQSIESFMQQHYEMNPGLDPATPAEVLRTLAESTDETIQSNVAQNLSAPEDVLRSLAKSSSVAVRVAVAANSATPQNVLLDLATDLVAKVRIAIAGNEESELEVFEKLIVDVDPEVRSTLARNPSLNRELLKVLTKDKEGLVRRNVAKNISATSEVLAFMTEDNDVWVRRNIASNPFATEEILLSMLNDEDEDVRNRLNDRLDTDFEDDFEDD
jgi:hypothetical protein